MCGIFGILTDNNNLINPDFLYTALDTLQNRGPDSKDIWISQNKKYGLGHTRLSIQDLSSNASQPMFNKKNNIGIVFNGEIYNHKKIRINKNFRSDIKWRSQSDTETILNTYIEYGIEKTLDSLNGMFAFAIIDLSLNKVFLCRDRIGEKPLYIYQDKNKIIFSSDLRFINSINSNSEINRSSIYELINKGYIASPRSIYTNVKKLLPGHISEISLNNFKIDTTQYWSTKDITEINYNIYKDLKEEELIYKLDSKISNVVEDHLISDVEVGTLLSGGIDSSLITSYVSKFSNSKIKTFTVGFENINYDESKNAREISKFLGTDHKQIIINPNDYTDVIYKLHNIYTEPFADSSQIPTYIVSKYASQYLKVVITGDGGDELFGGYNRYNLVKRFLDYPYLIKKILKNSLNLLPYNIWNQLFTLINSISGNKNIISQPADKIVKILAILNSRNEKEAYFNLTRSSNHTKNLLMNFNQSESYENEWNDAQFDFFQFESEKMMMTDIKNYLTDDVLCKVDRAAMYNSLETRHPFLDKRILEESAKIPINYKIKNNSGKYILKKLLYSKIPSKIFNKNKQGFAFPIDDLLKGPLHDWCNDLLDENMIKNQNFFNPKIINQIKNNYFSGKENLSSEIWSILMFQSWYINK